MKGLEALKGIFEKRLRLSDFVGKLTDFSRKASIKPFAYNLLKFGGDYYGFKI
jgi:hypothetical protein